jgi:hypothetical protein
MGKPGIGQHLDDQILEGDGGGDLELVAAEDIQEGEEEEVFVAYLPRVKTERKMKA